MSRNEGRGASRDGDQMKSKTLDVTHTPGRRLVRDAAEGAILVDLGAVPTYGLSQRTRYISVTPDALTAAAPELLQILRGIMEAHGNRTPERMSPDEVCEFHAAASLFFEDARAAIAKAEGR